MNKKTLLISSDYNQFFFKPIIFKLKNEIDDLSICLVNENIGTKLKRYFYSLMTFSLFEIFEILLTLIKFQFKKDIQYDHYLINNINENSFIDRINKNNYKLIILLNCPQIIKKETLSKIKVDVVNFHPGLLSNHRGLFPIFYALINRDLSIGISFHKVDIKIDNGELIDDIKIPINKKEGCFSIYKKLYYNDEVFKFIKNSILTYDSIKNNIKKKNTSKYYSFPSFSQIIKFKFLNF
tara:strand:- start:115 stop:828 length:714 start_codon:yes stop_codon:yes gene_type:complete